MPLVAETNTFNQRYVQIAEIAGRFGNRIVQDAAVSDESEAESARRSALHATEIILRAYEGVASVPKRKRFDRSDLAETVSAMSTIMPPTPETGTLNKVATGNGYFLRGSALIIATLLQLGVVPKLETVDPDRLAGSVFARGEAYELEAT